LVCRLAAEVKFSVLGHDLGKDVLSKSLANFERSRRVHAGTAAQFPDNDFDGTTIRHFRWIQKIFIAAARAAWQPTIPRIERKMGRRTADCLTGFRW
jgi:hypothetical protein